MKEYLVGEFRNKLKEALDKVEEGEEIIIRRHRDVYLLKKPFNKENYIRKEF